MSREIILLYFSLAIYSLFILGELYLSYKMRKQTYEWKDTAISFWFAMAGGTLDVLLRVFSFFVLNYFAQFGILKVQNTAFYPIWAWIVVFIAQDFFFYWLHRSEHSIRVLWAVHSNHHSSEFYNFAVALRSSVLQPLYRYVFYIPIALLGFDALTIMFVYAINQIYQFFLHTELIGKLGWWEKWFVTPSHHRVHHASNEQYLDKNMGQVLIIWDKLFGTFKAEDDAIKPIFGLTKNINTKNPIRAIFSEFINISKDIKSTTNWKNKLYYLIKSPNWKP